MKKQNHLAKADQSYSNCCLPTICQNRGPVPSSRRPNGISVRYLREVFPKEVVKCGRGLNSKIYNLDNLKFRSHGVFRRKGQDLYCLLDGKKGAAYIDCVDPVYKGPATVMVSYSWNYTIGSIIDTLEDFCKNEGQSPDDVYVWMCCFCVNQHRVYQRRTQKVMRIYQELYMNVYNIMASIGRVLAIISPFDDRNYINRTWCNFELFLAESCPFCELTLIMASNERNSFVDKVLEPHTVMHALSETAIENTCTSEESDRVLILKWIRVNVGYDEFNHAIKYLLRRWILSNFKSVANECEGKQSRGDTEKRKKYASFCSKIGNLMYDKEEYDVALKYYNASMRLHEKIEVKENYDIASIRRSIGLTLKQKGDINGALIDLRKALEMFRNITKEESDVIADVHAEIGLLLLNKGEIEDALIELKETLRICLQVLGPDHYSTAMNNNIIGKILLQKGDLDTSLLHFEEAFKILRKINPVHTDVAEIRSNIGTVFFRRNDMRSALVNYRKALHIQLKVIGRYHPDTALTYIHIGSALVELNELDGGLDKYQKALEIQFKVFGENNTDVACTSFKIGKLFLRKGEFDNALVAFKKAFDARLKVLGNDDPTTIEASKMIDEITLIRENRQDEISRNSVIA